MKYGLYYYKNTQNLGDDIWAYAQSLFYPQIDYLIDNTTVYKFKSKDNEKVASIFSAFIEPYNNEYSFFPPSNIIPFFIGSYFRPTMFEFLDTLPMQSYLSKYSPIGCRTRELAELFEEKGIAAYFSGCISLTLPNMNKKKQNYICLVDVPEYIVDFVKNKVGSRYELKLMTHDIDDIQAHSELSIEERFEIVKNHLEIYAGAHCVVTSRLHVALPCLTQNTPVLLTVTDEAKVGVNDMDRRMKDFFPMLNQCRYSDFLNDKVSYDFVSPTPNPETYISYRNDLIDKCKVFIENCEKGISNNICENNSFDDIMDVLEKKIYQLKCVIDSKNRYIAMMNENIIRQKNSLLSMQARLREYETFNEWENVEYFGNWEERSFVMSKFVPQECNSLLDIGCGEMHIRKFLPKGTKYFGCDYKKRDEDTIVCDLAKGEFPTVNVDIVFIAGVFEYLSNWKDVLKKCTTCCKQIIMSYSTIESAKERDSIWVNSIRFQDIVDEAEKNGFKLAGQDKFNTSDIFNFIKE